LEGAARFVVGDPHHSRPGFARVTG
jgi:hypothetical protein